MKELWKCSAQGCPPTITYTEFSDEEYLVKGGMKMVALFWFFIGFFVISTTLLARSLWRDKAREKEAKKREEDIVESPIGDGK